MRETDRQTQTDCQRSDTEEETWTEKETKRRIQGGKGMELEGGRGGLGKEMEERWSEGNG